MQMLKESSKTLNAMIEEGILYVTNGVGSWDKFVDVIFSKDHDIVSQVALTRVIRNHDSHSYERRGRKVELLVSGVGFYFFSRLPRFSLLSNAFFFLSFCFLFF